MSIGDIFLSTIIVLANSYKSSSAACRLLIPSSTARFTDRSCDGIIPLISSIVRNSSGIVGFPNRGMSTLSTFIPRPPKSLRTASSSFFDDIRFTNSSSDKPGNIFFVLFLTYPIMSCAIGEYVIPIGIMPISAVCRSGANASWSIRTAIPGFCSCSIGHCNRPRKARRNISMPPRCGAFTNISGIAPSLRRGLGLRLGSGRSLRLRLLHLHLLHDGLRRL